MEHPALDPWKRSSPKLSSSSSMCGYVYKKHYDFHYNIAEITIKTTTPLQSAIIGNIDGSSSDSMINLSPDMKVIALGRYHNHPYHIMAAPGALRFVDSNLDCEELLMSNCEIPKNGIGGPIISCSGLVLGMNFYKDPLTPFLPINIALKCLEHLQKYREVPRPWLGAKLSDLHIASLGELENLNQTFPLLLEGVVVRQMEPESPALRAGLCTGDVIVQFDGSTLSKTLQFQSLLLDNANKAVDVVVKRAGTIAPLTLSLLPQRSRQVNRWPIPKEFSYQPNH